MESLLRKSLAGLPLGGVRYFDVLGSTNDAALEWAAAGAPDFSIVVADEQTSGRGRMGRKWFTPPGSALAFSLILRPAAAEQASPALFAGLGALALVDALKSYGLAAQIKWPNDVLLNRKKVAGILVETVWLGDEVDCVVLGMGVNVTPGAVPPAAELNFPATCVQAEGAASIERFDLLHSLLVAIGRWRQRLGTPAFMQAWESVLAFRGEEIQIWQGAEENFLAVIEGLDADGSLRVLAGGQLRRLNFGEIHLRPL
jgi:BirA family biotin operon repressor/biotin-[acetyl-CoA-carboxylase] ligase